MLKIKKLNLISIGFLLIGISCSQNNSMKTPEIKRDLDFNQDWYFVQLEKEKNQSTEYSEYNFDHAEWQIVSLPHTANIEPLVVNDQWQGISWYRKQFSVDANNKNKIIYLEFEAAMQVADVWINGNHIKTNQGGYLPFTIDITKYVNYEKDNVLAVQLDNRDNKSIPPGKPIKTLDFCYYGGLYRNVKMHIVNPVHISDAVYANKTAGGGVFVNYENVTSDTAKFSVRSHVNNNSDSKKTIHIQTEILDPSGKTVLVQKSSGDFVNIQSDKHIEQKFVLQKPQLWEINSPKMYSVHSYVIVENEVVDFIKTAIGIRSISFSAQEGFVINGNKHYLRGTNRHQEYPYVGNALSDEAQYRDAFKIKQAGFDYIRLSHYPQSEAFMDACDELGLVVMNCIPGWQFMGEKEFQDLCYLNIRDLIRRDRNHPSVVLWETSLNESWMGDDFIETSQRITHEELPGKYTYSCGWQMGFDVFIQARQHGGLTDYADPDNGAIISEYGDWEYFAQNAGLDQPGFKNLLKEERNSRQFRGDGELRLLQQTMNFQEAHNDNQKTIAAGDGLWVMFDYNRGYDRTIEASGSMDIFRLPKFSHYFFQSQRDYQIKLEIVQSGPMVFIANYWTEESPLDVRVFSNCEYVELYLNGKFIEKRKPDQNIFTSHLGNPPFTFKLDKYVGGNLIAMGFVDGQEVAKHKVQSPLAPAAIKIEFDYSGKPLNRKSEDLIFIYAKIVDENGTVIPDYLGEVQFKVRGASLIGQNPINAEAGIAAILLQNKPGQDAIIVSANTSLDGLSLTGQNKIN